VTIPVVKTSINAPDLIDIAKALETNGPLVVQRALNAALNSTGAVATTAVRRNIVKITSASAGAVRDVVRTKRSNFEDLSFDIYGRGSPIPLIEFGAQQRGRGVSARAWGRRTIYRGTFIATMDSGHRGVFTRSKKGGARRVRQVDKRGRVYYSELPIRELAGPSIPRAMLQKEVVQTFNQIVGERLPLAFARELDRVMGRLTPKSQP